NYHEASLAIKDEMEKFAAMSAKEVEKIRSKAKKIADGCSWTKFVKYYEEAFKIALQDKNKNTKIKK
ncbi:MAG: glycosyl transferase, partial [Paludibacteraceae bacterium]|nr:glycosyl transferase [Paludibacteraceae bacterium]